ncbi:diguanylate cyclase domain-containing protein [Desulfatibacillum aliphaticivorans]|uniref:diguanylate cyclase domain-containing protein n=1 Tax=Desulfatibacillum aliphaticivorans TaxID=218208 RepID=UPI000481CDF7|nr:diguanylate cyclase [Desulfatibacillum aliphaticivorans]
MLYSQYSQTDSLTEVVYMAGAFKTASDTPIQLLKVSILANNPDTGESMERILERAEAFQCAGVARNTDELQSLAAQGGVHAVLLDHAPTLQEKILAQSLGLPLTLLDDDETQNEPIPSVCGRLQKDAANAASLEMVLNHALETHALIQDLGKACSRMNYLRENRETAERLGNIISMIGVAAHEVNQPLTSLLGHLELMSMNKDDAEKVLKYLDRVDESGEKIAYIVKQIQDLRHEHWANDGVFEADGRSLFVLFAGANGDIFEHLSKVLEGYPKIHGARAVGDQIPVETDVVVAEYSTGHDWQSWIEAAREADKNIVLTAECRDMPGACKIVNIGQADGVMTAWAPESECLQILTQVCEVGYFRKKANNARLRLRNTALKDDLTGLVTDSIMKRAVGKEIPRSETMKRTSSLLAIHVEDMENIQEKIGPKGLNHAILFVGKHLRRNSHREDLPSRVFGDRFLVLLPGRDKNEAREWCHCLTQAIEQNPFDWFGKTMDIGITAGIVEHVGGQPETMERWMENAEQALAQARAQGPGTVFVLE